MTASMAARASGHSVKEVMEEMSAEQAVILEHVYLLSEGAKLYLPHYEEKSKHVPKGGACPWNQ